MYFLVYKNPGETPLAALLRLRELAGIASSVPLTYAGRLDPLAEGLLIVLGAEARKEKERFLGLDKVYECTVLLGFATDTGDVLGLLKKQNPDSVEHHVSVQQIATTVASCVGEQSQTYPKFSSKTVEGAPLFALAKSGALPDVLPSRIITVNFIDVLGTDDVSEQALLACILEKINLVQGDFRQKEIALMWQKTLDAKSSKKYQLVHLRISASSGTYVRVLAEKIGGLLGMPALAFHIYRTHIGEYSVASLNGQSFCAIPNT